MTVSLSIEIENEGCGYEHIEESSGGAVARGMLDMWALEADSGVMLLLVVGRVEG
jgi:hypothetical protein